MSGEHDPAAQQQREEQLAKLVTTPDHAERKAIARALGIMAPETEQTEQTRLVVRLVRQDGIFWAQIEGIDTIAQYRTGETGAMISLLETAARLAVFPFLTEPEHAALFAGAGGDDS